MQRSIGGYEGCLTPKLTGAVARSAEGTATGHENAEGMACSGVRVERPVRLANEGTVFHFICGPAHRAARVGCHLVLIL